MMRRRGFTLIELLVVIAVIVTHTSSPLMLARQGQIPSARRWSGERPTPNPGRAPALPAGLAGSGCSHPDAAGPDLPRGSSPAPQDLQDCARRGVFPLSRPGAAGAPSRRGVGPWKY